MRMLGAVLVAGGCLWLGEKKARRLRTRVAVLDSLNDVLEQMEREMRLRLPTLPALMKQLSQQADPLVRPLFEESAVALEALHETSFSKVWPQLVEQLPALDVQDRRSLSSLGQILGRYDGPGQAESIAGVMRKLHRQREQAQADCLRLGRVYRTVGAAGGGFLIILLL